MSEGVLAQLKVVIGAEISKLKSGLDEAAVSADRGAKKIERSFSGLGSTFARLLGPLSATGREIRVALDGIGESGGEVAKHLSALGPGFAMIGGIGVGATVGLGAGFFALAEHAAEAGAMIYDASEKTGIGAAEMSGLAAISKETGGNFQNLSTSLARMGANLTNALIDPSTIGARELKSLLGGTQQLTKFGLLPMGERLEIVAQKAFALHDVGQRNAILQALLGRGWQENVDTLKSLAEQGYGPAIAQAKKFGLFFDDHGAEQAKKFTIQWADLKAQLGGLALSLGQTVVPAFEKLLVVLVGMEATASNAFYKLKALDEFQGLKFGAGKIDWAKSNRDPLAEMTGYLTHIQSLVQAAKTSDKASLSLDNGKTGAGKSRIAAYLESLKQELIGLSQGPAAAGIAKLKELGATQKQLVEGKLLLGEIQSLKDAKKYGDEFTKSQEKMQTVLAKISANAAEKLKNDLAGAAESSANLVQELSSAGRQILGLGSDYSEMLKKQAAEAAGTGGPVGGFVPGFTPSGFGAMRFNMDNLDKDAQKLGKTFSQSFQRMIEGGESFSQMLKNLRNELELFIIKSLVFNEIAKALKGAGGFLGVIGSFFGGLAAPGRAIGGPVTAGNLYMVGERGPEYFAPTVSGSIIPSGKAGMAGGRPLAIVQHFNINTPNADSFRRSMTQIMADAHRQVTMAAVRNG